MSDATSTALVERPVRNQIALGERGLQLSTLDDMFRFASYVSASGLAPKGLEKPESIFVALQLGAELSLSPMASLQNIAVINGRPGIFGDSALALVRGSGVLVYFAEFEINDKIEPLVRRLCVIEARIAWHEHKEYDVAEADEAAANKLREQIAEMPLSRTAEDYGALCAVMRAGERAPTIEVFTIADAKKAGLLERNPVWRAYPHRMAKFRARSFALRDKFTDVLKGLKTTEELNDTPPGHGFEHAQPIVGAEVTDVPQRPPVPAKGAAAIAAVDVPAAAPDAAAAAPVTTEPAPKKRAARGSRTAAEQAAPTVDVPAEPAPAATEAAQPVNPAPENPPAPAAATPDPAATKKQPTYAEIMALPKDEKNIITVPFNGAVEEWLQKKTANPQYPLVLLAEIKIRDTGEIVKAVFDPQLDEVCKKSKTDTLVIDGVLERRKGSGENWFWWVLKAAIDESQLI